MRAFDAALGTPWAMQSHALEQLLTIAARENDVTPEVLEKYRAEAVGKAESMEKRGSVAILNATGPLFRRANLFTEVSGATSYEVMRRDMQVALDDRDIKSILLNIDSPGGDANGVGELAKAIYASEKPVVAYVGGTGASGAYWIAAAASEIVVDDAATVGSIGVVLGLTDRSARDAASGVRRYEFVSSQSPKKRSDPGTESGASDYQKLADEMAEVFISAVAKYRGTDAETVASDFGQGGVLVGARAVEAGMADRVGTFEETLARMANGERLTRAPGMRNRRRVARDEPAAQPAATHSQPEETLMADENKAGEQPATPTVDVEAERKAAVDADRKRRKEVMALDNYQGREALGEHLYSSTDWDVATIDAALAAAPKAEEKQPDPAADYETQRTATAGAGLGGEPKPSKPKASIDRSEIYAARRAATQE